MKTWRRITLGVCPLRSHSVALSSFPRTLLLNHIQLILVGTTQNRTSPTPFGIRIMIRILTIITYIKCCVSHSVVFYSLRLHGLQPTSLLFPWNSPGKNTGEGCHFLLQGIFLTQELHPSLLHHMWSLYRQSHQGLPVLRKMLKVSGKVREIQPRLDLFEGQKERQIQKTDLWTQREKERAGQTERGALACIHYHV